MKDVFFDQIDVIGMGNLLAPFFASEIYLDFLEKKISTENWFPRVWLRYIDDIFAVVKTDKLNEILEKLNTLYPAKIKFTHVIEENGAIPFLDVLVLVQRSENKLSFKIYRKSTNTMRYITSDSFHCF